MLGVFDLLEVMLEIWLLVVGVDLAGVTLGGTTTSSLLSTMIRDFWHDENDGIVSEPKGAISSLK